MFNIFMNSISKIPLSVDCHLMLYADDILLFKPIENSADLSDFQRDLHHWIQKYGLNPNHQKTQYLSISRSRNRPALTISLNGHTLHPCLDVKYLEVTITTNLSWSLHIDNIAKTTKRLLGRIQKNLRDAPNHL